jgi:DNA-binding transcriptional regulator YbjK
VIAERGTEQVTHRSVAAAAGVPLGSTTYYFASRDELVREAFRRYVTRVLGLLSEIFVESRPSDAAGLVAFLVEVARREVSGRWTVIVEYELLLRAARDPELAADFRRYERTLTWAWQRRWSPGAPQPFEAARTLIALVRLRARRTHASRRRPRRPLSPPEPDRGSALRPANPARRSSHEGPPPVPDTTPESRPHSPTRAWSSSTAWCRRRLERAERGARAPAWARRSGPTSFSGAAPSAPAGWSRAPRPAASS